MNKSHAFTFLEKTLQMSLVEEQVREFLDTNNLSQEIRIEFRNIKYKEKGKVTEKQILDLTARDILYFEYIKLEKTIRIVTDNKEYKYSETISQLEKRIGALGFVICCRGILVNLERIKRIKLMKNNNPNIKYPIGNFYVWIILVYF